MITLLLATLTFILLFVVAKQRNNMDNAYDTIADYYDITDTLRNKLVEFKAHANNLVAQRDFEITGLSMKLDSANETINESIVEYNELDEKYNQVLDFARQALQDSIVSYVETIQSDYDFVDSIVYDDYKLSLCESILHYHSDTLKSFLKKYNRSVPQNANELYNSGYIEFTVTDLYQRQENNILDSLVIGEITTNNPDIVEYAPMSVLDGLHGLPVILDDDYMTISIDKLLCAKLVEPKYIVNSSTDYTQESVKSYQWDMDSAVTMLDLLASNKYQFKDMQSVANRVCIKNGLTYRYTITEYKA